VIPQPPAIVNFEDLISTVEDRAFTVACAVDGGKPKATIEWFVAANSDGSGVSPHPYPTLSSRRYCTPSSPFLPDPLRPGHERVRVC
jgi:hypothetical protein